jgi:peptidoglycan/LPS O-acetylase OafA/YrhL
MPERGTSVLGRSTKMAVRSTPLILPLRHRADLQGLRAVAVLLVVLDHADLPFLHGGFVGVDVFFVLSGFLITSLLLSKAAERARISLADFYRRRARRILPAAALTLVVTDIVAWQLLNFVRAKETVTDSIWASVFAANIHFAREQSDYFARAKPPSPLLHFWTLSVEEQFYLVWPLLLGLALFGVLFGRQGGRLTEAAVTRSLAVIVVAGSLSLAWSIYYTETSAQAAYFSTFARVWELALGAALAIAAPRLIRLAPSLQFAFGWLGLACIGLAAFLYTDRTPFPGYAALLPTVGAALVIGAGVRGPGPRFGAAGALSVPPMQFVGDRSYTYYLWHWPFLVIAAQYAGHELSTGTNLLLLTGAFVLSVCTYAVYENPLRHMKWRSPMGLLLWPASAAAVLVVALPLLGSFGHTAARIEAASAAVRTAPLADPASRGLSTHRAAKALPAVVAAVRAAERGAPLPKAYKPAADKLESDQYHFPSKYCRPNLAESSSKICRLGDSHSPKAIVVFGDSHAMMWMPTVLRMARRDHWLVLPIVKPSCVPKKWVEGGFPTCNAWFKWAIKQAANLRPQVSLVAAKWSNTRRPEALPGVTAAVAKLRRSSASVIVLGDPPEQFKTPVDCLLAPNATMKTCTPRARKVDLQTDSAIARMARKHHAGFINVRGWVCARSKAHGHPVRCPLVVNRTVTRTDRDHLSRTYALELARSFRIAFRKALFA